MDRSKNVVLFLRKHLMGQNSIELYGQTIANNVDNCILKELPEYSNSILGIIKNIRFAVREQGPINHVLQNTEGYVLPFLKGKKIITVHDLGTMKTHGMIAYLILYIMNIIPSILFADVIHTNSLQTKKELLGKLNLAHNKTMNIYLCSFCTSKFVNKEFNKVEPCILHIGTAKRKNLDNVISALKGINCLLVIVGILSEHQKELLNLHQLKYENYYDITTEKLNQLYERADLITFPSFYEGFGLVVLEGQSAGRPVLTSNSVPVLKEVGGNAACYINPFSVDSIREGILKIIDNDEYRGMLVNNGFNNIQTFSLHKFITSINVLYKSLN